MEVEPLPEKAAVAVYALWTVGVLGAVALIVVGLVNVFRGSSNDKPSGDAYAQLPGDRSSVAPVISPTTTRVGDGQVKEKPPADSGKPRPRFEDDDPPPTPQPSEKPEPPKDKPRPQPEEKPAPPQEKPRPDPEEKPAPPEQKPSPAPQEKPPPRPTPPGPDDTPRAPDPPPPVVKEAPKPAPPRVALKLTSHLLTLAVSPDGSCFAGGEMSGREGASVRVWSLPEGKELQAIKISDSSPVPAVAISPDSRLLAVGFQAGFKVELRLYELATGKLQGTLTSGQEHNAFEAVAFSPDGKKVAAGTTSGLVFLWDVATGRLVGGLKQAHNAGLRRLVFSPDGATILTGGHNQPAGALMYAGEVKAWDVATGKGNVLLTGLPGSVHELAVASDGALLAVSYGEAFVGGVKLLELPSGKEATKIDAGKPIRTAVFSADGKELLVGWHDDSVRLFEVATGKKLGGFRCPSASRVAFSTDGETVIVASMTWNLSLFDRKDARPLLDEPGKPAFVIPDRRPPKLIEVSYPRVVLKSIDRARITFLVEGKSVQVAVSPMTVFKDGTGLPVQGPERARLFAPRNTVDVRAGKKDDSEPLATALEVRFVSLDAEDFAKRMTKRLAGAIVKMVDQNTAVLAVKGGELRALMPVDCKVFDLEGKQLTGTDIWRVWNVGNVVDATGIDNGDPALNLVEVRLVKGELRPLPAVVKQKDAWKNAIVVTRMEKGVLQHSFKTEDGEIVAPIGPASQFFDQEGKRIPFLRVLKDGNVVDLTVQNLPLGHKLIREVRLVKEAGQP